MYDPKYKMRHRPPSIKRLFKWGDYNPPMVGDPEVARWCGSRNYWDRRCHILYAHAIALKRGDVTALIPHRGLWFHAV